MGRPGSAAVGTSCGTGGAPATRRCGTGASAGIGAATARKLARRGFHVLAGVRRTEDADALRAPGIEPVILDITEPGHIAELAARVDTLRALVNNAGISVNAPVEALPLDEWRRLFEVNLFGHVAVTQALLPALLRDTGRVINISSVGGKIAMATYGPYAGTKFAMEAVGDALRRELAPSGVRVVVVEPGGVRTEMADRGIATTSGLAAAMSPEHQQRYGPLVRAVIKAGHRVHRERHIRRGCRQGDRQGGDHGDAPRAPHHRSRRGPAHPPVANPAGPAARPRRHARPASALRELRDSRPRSGAKDGGHDALRRIISGNAMSIETSVPLREAAFHGLCWWSWPTADAVTWG
ncbi:MAG TPA: SDR family NAD(P)-dependent oxidoreductase [Pseudonocardiaceae bacterium]